LIELGVLPVARGWRPGRLGPGEAGRCRHAGSGTMFGRRL